MYSLSNSALVVVSITANVSLIKQLMHSLASRLLQAPHRLFLCGLQHYMIRMLRPAFAITALSIVLSKQVGLAHSGQSVERKDGCMQRALEALLSDWMGVLSGLRRLWEADEVTSLITSPGEENPPHTPLAALIDAGDLRGLVAQLTQSWQAAFAQVEEFRQVRKEADTQLW
jgi:hypothetical protein